MNSCFGCVLFMHVACLWMCLLFYSCLVCIYVCAYDSKSKVHCESALGPGTSGHPYYCAPLVCVPAVLGGLAVWKKTKPSVRALRSVVQTIPHAGTFPMLEAKLEAEARRSPLPRFSEKVVRAMCTVMVIQYHCDKTFSNHLGGGEGRSPVKIFSLHFL